MEDYLYHKCLYLPSEGTKNKLESMKDEEWEILERNAMGTIQLCIVALVAFNILKEKTTTDMMKELSKLYEKSSASNKAFLMKCLFNMKIEREAL